MHTQIITLAVLAGIAHAQTAPADPPVIKISYPVLNQTSEITFDDPHARDSLFGSELAFRDNQLIICAPWYFDDQPHRSSDGWGRVFVYDPTTGTQRGMLEQTQDQGVQAFGAIVASDGEHTAVSGWLDGQDRIYIYEGDASTPSHYLLHHSEPGEYAYSMAIHADMIAVMYRQDVNDAYSVLYDITTGAELARFTGAVASFTDSRTQNLALHDGVLALRTEDGTSDPHVDVYSTETYELLYTITPQNSTSGFGASIAINDEFVVLGNAFSRVPSPRDPDATGIIQIYDRQTGELASEFAPGDIVDDSFVANSIAMNDRYVAISSLWDRIVYLIDLEDTDRAWRLGDDNYPSHGADDFGSALSMSDNLLAVGSNTTVVTYNIGCPADRDGDRSLTALDVLDFIQAFGDNESSADLNGDNQFDFHDVSHYLRLYYAGCFE